MTPRKHDETHDPGGQNLGAGLASSRCPLVLTRIGGPAPAQGEPRAKCACALRVHRAGLRPLGAEVWIPECGEEFCQLRGNEGAVENPPGGDGIKLNRGRASGRKPGVACPGCSGADSEARGEQDGPAPGARAVPGPVPVVRASGRPQRGAAHRCGRRRRCQDGHKEWRGESSGPLGPVTARATGIRGLGGGLYLRLHTSCISSLPPPRWKARRPGGNFT